MDELLPIGEFSERCGLSVKMLRSYGAAGLLTPAAVDRDSGYRYYAPAQEPRARLIGLLRQGGLPLTEVASFLREPTAERLDRWERKLDCDAASRREALAAARAHLGLPTSAPDRAADAVTKTGGTELPSLTAGAATETGRVRPTNQDAVLVEDGVYVVADGTGSGGEVASAVAVETLGAAFPANPTREGLVSASRRAARAVWRRAECGDEPPMGSTIAAVAVVDDDALAAANVGDSRVYHFREGALRRLTRDHTVVGELVSSGQLAERDARHHPQRSILTKILGIGPEMEPDVVDVPSAPGDRLVLCTDGLYNELEDDEISDLLSRIADPELAAAALVDRAIARGGNDNVSVIVVNVG